MGRRDGVEQLVGTADKPVIRAAVAATVLAVNALLLKRLRLPLTPT